MPKKQSARPSIGNLTHHVRGLVILRWRRKMAASQWHSDLSNDDRDDIAQDALLVLLESGDHSRRALYSAIDKAISRLRYERYERAGAFISLEEVTKYDGNNILEREYREQGEPQDIPFWFACRVLETVQDHKQAMPMISTVAALGATGSKTAAAELTGKTRQTIHNHVNRLKEIYSLFDPCRDQSAID